jgi:hypothetical protein
MRQLYDEIMMKTYGEIMMKSVSKCLAGMKGWDPEFEPSVEDITARLSMRYGNSLNSLSLASSVTLGNFPIQSSLFVLGGLTFLRSRLLVYSCACAEH